MIKFKGLIAPTDVPTGDGRMFAKERMTHRPLPIPLMARFGSGGHDGAVPVGKIESIYPGPGGYWAEGCFLDPMVIPEVPKAVYMLQEKVMGPSVDLDRDYTVKVIPHPVRPDKKAAMFESYNVIGTTLVPMPAFYQVHMSVETAQEEALLASAGVDVEKLYKGDFSGLDMESELDIATSLAQEDTAECGCAGDDSSQEFSQEIVPTLEQVAMDSQTSNNAATVMVTGASVPATITVTFNAYPGMMGSEETPVAVVKVLDNKTVVKVPHSSPEKEACYLDDEGNCPVCGY